MRRSTRQGAQRHRAAHEAKIGVRKLAFLWLTYAIVGFSAAASDLGVGLVVGTYNTSGRNAFRPITRVKFRTRTRMGSRRRR